MPPSQPPNGSSGQCPPPLNIIKKTRHRLNPSASPRRMNPDVDESSGSISDSPALDQPLTVVKKRASRIQLCSSQELDRSFHSEQSKAVTEYPTPVAFLDPMTPKPGQSKIRRRWNSRQFRRPFAPKAPNTHRPSYNGYSSTKPTCQEYESCNSSDSSSLCSSIGSAHQQGIGTRLSSYQWGQDSNEGLEEQAHQHNVSIARNSRQANYPSSSACGSDDSVLDPYLLVPNVSITPEVRTVDGGQSSLWAAIEISGQLFRPYVSGDVYSTPGISSLFMPVHHSRDGLSRYGYLYDIKLDILPTGHSSIIDIIDDNTSRTIHPGSSILVLANIQLDASLPPQTGGKRKHGPDDLFEDLELQLGSVKTEYVQVRLGYCHSGFPMSADASIASGISSNRTRLETTTTGVIKRHTPASIWSPHSIPASNALFPIIASHWGPVRAHDIMDNITTPRPSPHRMVRGNNKSMSSIRLGKNEPKTPETVVKAPRAPQVPRRQASLGRQFLSLDNDSVDPARKIWTEMRRTSSGRDPPSIHMNKLRNLPASRSTALEPVTSPKAAAAVPPLQSEVERRRQQIKDTALRNKRSIGADSLRSLVPSLANFHLDGSGEAGNGTIREQQDETETEMETHSAQQRSEGRWSFGSWW